jgi:putative Mg2+ transporter-C (MgtC) family protein
MEFSEFLGNSAAALLLGVVIGLERQWHQHPAGLRTNALVCLGAALFVSLSRLMHDEGSPTRIASYVVSGIGFLGGGVILREGMTVKGMNTAATLWCSAAVGTLCGSGFARFGVAGTAAVLGLHLALRPVAHWVDARVKTATDVEAQYRLKVVCPRKEAGLIRTILLRHVNAHAAMTVQGFDTHDTDREDQAAVVVNIYSTRRSERALEEVVTRINIEPGVSSVSWERA